MPAGAPGGIMPKKTFISYASKDGQVAPLPLAPRPRGEEGVMKKVFISYASKDRQTALTICHALEARGQQCWISCRDIHPGENYQESIVHAIRGAGVMLLILSANANNSDEIKK